MVIVLVIFIIFLIGCSIGDWEIILLFGFPFLVGIAGGLFAIFYKDESEERLKNDPEFRKKIEDILRKNGKRLSL